jgi:hypothetical protein
LTKQATRNKESKNNQQKRPKLNQKNNPKTEKIITPYYKQNKKISYTLS